ncbi:HAD family hydrolase [Candidatus Thorarchaeota archaeon]|nr:MAG: HAD family hydrolase [Candidatus Thorarchaeota archaeon]
MSGDPPVLTPLNISRFDAIIFDLDSTLVDTHSYPMVASDWLLTKSNVESTEHKELYLRNLVMRYFNAIQVIVEGGQYIPPFEIVKAAMANSLEDLGYYPDQKLVHDATIYFRSLHIEMATPYPGIEKMLENLQNHGLKLGVLSNSFEGNASIILQNFDLQNYFQAIIDCGDVNAYKPMTQPFIKILEILDVEPSRALYVGDEYYADMVGAKTVNLTTAWINNRNQSLEDLIVKYGSKNTPDYVTTSITEFASML